jgi:rhodanese-related sulfurtransferase
MASSPQIDLDQFAASHASGVVVDVRDPNEYTAGYVPSALRT